MSHSNVSEARSTADENYTCGEISAVPKIEIKQECNDTDAPCNASHEDDYHQIAPACIDGFDEPTKNGHLIINEVKFLRWWDDIEESYKLFEEQFCRDIENNLLAVRSKHFSITKLIRHYEIEVAITSFINNNLESNRDVGVYIGYTSPGAFSRMFDETVKSPARKNGGNRGLLTIRRFIMNIESVPENLRSNFTEKAVLCHYFESKYAKYLLNSAKAHTFDKINGWIYLTFHAAKPMTDRTPAAHMTVPMVNLMSDDTNDVRGSKNTGELFSPKVEESFIKVDAYYNCKYCHKRYKEVKAGLSMYARKHYACCTLRKKENHDLLQ